MSKVDVYAFQVVGANFVIGTSWVNLALTKCAQSKIDKDDVGRWLLEAESLMGSEAKSELIRDFIEKHNPDSHSLKTVSEMIGTISFSFSVLQAP